MSSKPETVLKDRIVKALEKEFPGIYVVKVHGGPFQERGIPDLILCWNGRFIGMELKYGPGKPSVQQKFHIQRIRQAGGIAHIVRSVEKAVQIVRKIT